jgi:hypothetical protein
MKNNSKTETTMKTILARFAGTPGLLTVHLLFASLFMLINTLRLPAQNVVLSGALGGRITDLSGAVVPGAALEIRSLATGQQHTGLTGRDGTYQFLALMPGTYSVTATAKGFHEVEALVRVLVGNTTSQDLKLGVGAGGETVKVSGAMPLLRPTESSASNVLDHSFIEDLPLNGRRYTDFEILTPNTSYDGDTGLVSIAGQQGGEDSGYANGNGSSAFTVDGSNATNNYFADIIGRYRIPYLYGEDSIQEFQVSVSPYSAVYGGGAGFVNAVTRSGSNVFHGSAFYYNRNSATGANDELDEQAGIPKQQDNLQQFGAGVGGPIVRNHLWFFLDYEQQLRNDPISVINPALSTNSSNLTALFTEPGGFNIAPGTRLPAPNGNLPLPNIDTDADVAAGPTDPLYPLYLQQVSNALNALNSNLGTKARKRNDLVFTPRLDLPAHLPREPLSQRELGTTSILPAAKSPIRRSATTAPQTLANDNVHTFESSLGWTHTFSSHVLNELHAGTSQDNEVATPTGLAPNQPTTILDSPSAFTLGNAAFSIGRVFERQYSAAERTRSGDGQAHLAIWLRFQLRARDSDTNDGGADPNEAVDFGSPVGLLRILPAYRISRLGSTTTSVRHRGKSDLRLCRALLRLLRAGLLPGLAPDS